MAAIRHALGQLLDGAKEEKRKDSFADIVAGWKREKFWKARKSMRKKINNRGDVCETMGGTSSWWRYQAAAWMSSHLGAHLCQALLAFGSILSRELGGSCSRGFSSRHITNTQAAGAKRNQSASSRVWRGAISRAVCEHARVNSPRRGRGVCLRTLLLFIIFFHPHTNTHANKQTSININSVTISFEKGRTNWEKSSRNRLGERSNSNSVSTTFFSTFY